MSRRSVAVAGFLVVLSSCASAPSRRAVLDALEAGQTDEAVRRYASREGGPDPELLSKVAEHLLLDAARSDRRDVREAAFLELAFAGTHADEALTELSRSRERPIVSARALRVRADRGDAGAIRALRAMLSDDDPEVLAEAARFARPENDAARLRAWLEHPNADLRASAARALSGRPDRVSRHALSEAARRDPSPTVRIAAIGALATHGPSATDALRERTNDPDVAVRMAALRALVEVAGDGALDPLRRALAEPLSPSVVEAARLLAAKGDGSLVGDARALLYRALSAGTPVVRAQAAIALLTVPSDRDLERALGDALAAERDPSVRLQIARALLQHRVAVESAQRSVRDLLEAPGMPGVQAATLLAPARDRAALARLRRGLTSDAPLERAVAARSLARDARLPDAAIPALRDQDPIVRIRAAGGVLAAGYR